MNDLMKYPNTDITPHVGDIVEYCHEKDLMTIEEVINTAEIQKKWGVDNNGIMIKGGIFGLVFVELNQDTEIKFIKRHES